MKIVISSFYKCNLFSKTNFVIKENFTVTQDELLLQSNSQNRFDKLLVDYNCKWHPSKTFKDNKLAILIPIKDSPELLNYTLNNLLSNGLNKLAEIIVIDDRSEVNLFEISKKNNISYLRVDNKKGFNFSMLNNIPAFLCWEASYENIIAWNSDLWIPDGKLCYVEKILKNHKSSNAVISGTKLLYPTFSWNGEGTPKNISCTFPSKIKNFRGKVQFGGSFFYYNRLVNAYIPDHFLRFGDKDNHIVNSNKGDLFVTGAFHLFNLKWFIESGGYNPSLSKNLQDVEVCLRANELSKRVMYWGKDVYLWHDESVVLHKEGKFDHQITSDVMLYSKIYPSDKYMGLARNL